MFVAPPHHLPATASALPRGHLDDNTALAVLRTSREHGGLELSVEHAQRLWPVLRGLLVHFTLAKESRSGNTLIVQSQLSDEPRHRAMRQLSAKPGAKPGATPGAAPREVMVLAVVPFPHVTCVRVLNALQRRASDGAELCWSSGCGVDLDGCFVVVERSARRADAAKSSPPVVRARTTVLPALCA